MRQRRRQAHQRGTGTARSRAGFDQLVAAGVIRPPVDTASPVEEWPTFSLAAGTTASLVDADRGDTEHPASGWPNPYAEG